MHRLSGASKGFKGVIQKILMNGFQLPITSRLSDCRDNSNNNIGGCGFNIAYYDGLPCPLSKNPCLNNGICVPELNQFTCKCLSNFKGKYCELGI